MQKRILCVKAKKKDKRDYSFFIIPDSIRRYLPQHEYTSCTAESSVRGGVRPERGREVGVPPRFLSAKPEAA